MAGGIRDGILSPLQTAGLQGNCISYRDARVSELKEISGNRDVSQGGTTSGLTAASAIAALQEAGSKLSRDMLKSAYRAFAKECYLIIELMRQFYDEERVYRITGPTGQTEFVPFSGQALRPQPVGMVGGAALDMMDFEGIEKVRERVQQNGTLYQQLQQAMEQVQKMAGLLDQMTGSNMSAAAGAAAQAAGASGGGGGGTSEGLSATNGLGAQVGSGGNSLATQAAKRAMNVNNPNK